MSTAPEYMLPAFQEKTEDSPSVLDVRIQSAQRSLCNLRVDTGIQQGAETKLLETKEYCVGSSLACQVILRETDIAAKHFTVCHSGNVIAIHCLATPMSINGHELAVNDKYTATGLALIRIGGVSLVLQIHYYEALDARTSTHTSESRFNDDPDSQENSLDHYDEENIDKNDIGLNSQGLPHKPVEPMQADIAVGKWLTIFLLVLLLALFLVWQVGVNMSSKPQVISVRDSLSTSNFNGLSAENNDGIWTISGYLATYKESVEFEQWLERSRVQVENNVLVGELISERILDVFRVHGIAATVSVAVEKLNHIIAMVKISEDDLELIASVESRVLADVPGIHKIVIDNTVPVTVEPVVYKVPDPGKRVVMVISDHPAYVVTQDQSRYFVGSLLPTGQTIESIINGEVVLVKDGTRTSLQF